MLRMKGHNYELITQNFQLALVESRDMAEKSSSLILSFPDFFFEGKYNLR